VAFSNHLEALRSQDQGPPWAKKEREDATVRALEMAWPTETEEDWRYSVVDQLGLDSYSIGAANSYPTWQGLPPELTDLSRFSAVVRCAGGRVVASEGEMARELVIPIAEADGLSHVVFWGPEARDRFGVVGDAICYDPAILVVPQGMILEAPILVVHALEGRHSFVPTRTVVLAGASCRVEVVEVFVSAGEDSFGVSSTRVVAEEGAQVTYGGLQLLDERDRQVWQLRLEAGRNVSVSSFSVSLGGAYARLQTESYLKGPDSSADIGAAYLGSGEQVLDFRTNQLHCAPYTRSDLLFKGAVGGSARSVYTGLITVAKGAVGTDAFQTNRNLVLSEGASAYSVPNLDIEENDVRCSHASAVGPLDPDLVFYLESKGIEPAEVRRLLVEGFFSDGLERIPDLWLRQVARGLVSEKILKAVTA
jgi:Fe-S cluster assembly protein SufD